MLQALVLASGVAVVAVACTVGPSPSLPRESAVRTGGHRLDDADVRHVGRGVGEERGRALALQEDIRRRLARLGDEDRAVVFNDLLPALIVIAPARATGLVDEIPPSALRAELTATVAQRWGWTDPAQAYQWARQLGREADSLDAARQVLHQWARREPSAAAAVFLRDRWTDRRLFHDIVHHWSHRDPDAVLDWMLAQPDADLRDGGLARIGAVMAERDPHRALGLATSRIADAYVRDTAVAAIATTWAQRDPAAAEAWLRTWAGASHRDAAEDGDLR